MERQRKSRKDGHPAKMCQVFIHMWDALNHTRNQHSLPSPTLLPSSPLCLRPRPCHCTAGHAACWFSSGWPDRDIRGWRTPDRNLSFSTCSQQAPMGRQPRLSPLQKATRLNTRIGCSQDPGMDESTREWPKKTDDTILPTPHDPSLCFCFFFWKKKVRYVRIGDL